MTLTPARPVPEASTPEQQRLEVELLLGERVATPLELATADPILIHGGSGVAADRWRSLGALPLRREGTALVIAVPSHWGGEQREALLQELGDQASGCRFQLALPADLAKALTPRPAAAQAQSPGTRSLVEGLNLPGESELTEVQDSDDLETSSGAATTSPVVSLVDRILIEALQSGASDIHVEPQENCLEVRFRLDGVLHKLLDDLPKSLIPAVTSRLKIMADLDIAERRMPQDGRIRRNYRGRKMDFRVSTLPSRHGEKVVMRLLDSGATQLGLDTLITDMKARGTLRSMGSKPYGMILVTGPTGSGKSTTLYALLAERNDPAINISTVEDPIEYTLKGITQTQVNRDKGFDFSTALRAFMRQDPDVLLVGETRDLETAKTAIEAALTGHLVLTTLHCNDAVSAFARLDEMGVEPFLVSASLLGVVSQRLLRRVCNHCRIPYKPSAEDLARFGLLASREAAITFYRALRTNPGPEACPHCQGNGYKGRVGVYEILAMNDNLAAAVAKRATTDVMRRLALENGMKTLLGYGLELVREGHTTLEEVERMLLTDTGLESERRARALHTLSCQGCGAGLQDDWLECPYCLTTRE
jgi:type IV pilus assembly protein PilB